MRYRVLVGWSATAMVFLLPIVASFFFWSDLLYDWSENILRAPWSPWTIGVLLVALLAGDLILPVPSSVLGIASGSLLGFWPGTFVTWFGMTAGCCVGYVLGIGPGRKIAGRLVGEKEIARLAAIHTSIGDWVVVVFRAVPVLAETSVIFAGTAKMSLKRFFLMAGLANAGIAIIYAAVGTFALTVESFLPALAAAIVLPSVVMFCLWLRR